MCVCVILLFFKGSTLFLYNNCVIWYHSKWEWNMWWILTGTEMKFKPLLYAITQVMKNKITQLKSGKIQNGKNAGGFNWHRGWSFWRGGVVSCFIKTRKNVRTKKTKCNIRRRKKRRRRRKKKKEEERRSGFIINNQPAFHSGFP